MALRVRPNDARTRYNFAIALGRARQADEAQRQLEEAVRLEPEFGDARLVLGNLLMARGDREGALEQLRKAATAADPQTREAAAAMLKELEIR